MRIARRCPVLLLVMAGLVGLSACVPTPQPDADQSALEQAAAQATAIVRQARATALILSAGSTATALIAAANAQGAAETPHPEPSSTPIPAQPLQNADLTLPAPDLSATPLATAVTESSGKIEIISVSIAAEGAYICVQYKAPPLVAHKWWQGMVSLKDEMTGAVYDQIPVAPVIGPLIARPVQEGQLGYVMLVNEAPVLKVGAQVTVKLGDYLFEHLIVQ